MKSSFSRPLAVCLSASAILINGALSGCGGGGGAADGSTVTPDSAPTTTNPTPTTTPTTVYPTDTSKATLVGQRGPLSGDLNKRAEEIKADVRASTVYIETDGTQLEPNGLTGVTTLSRFRGSGFVMTNEGHVITNAHVVRGSGLYTVQVDGRSRAVSAELLSVAECEDLAVLRMVSGAPYKPLSWYGKAPTISLKVGAAGFPADVSSSSDNAPYVFTEGIVNTDVLVENNYWSSAEMFYHSATISGGSSGGPMVELDTGTVVGINYAGSTSRNMALSGTTAQGIIDQLLQSKDVLSIGFAGEMFYRYYDAKDVLVGYGLKNQVPAGAVALAPVGVWVRGVSAGGKAKRSGILPGDIITAIAGVRLDLQDTSMGTYCSAMRSNNPNAPGRVLDVEIVRPKAGGLVCTGEINGKTLGLKETPSTACPEAPVPVITKFIGSVSGANMNHSLTLTVTNGSVTGTGTWSDGTRPITGSVSADGVMTLTEVATPTRSLYYWAKYNAATKTFAGSVNSVANGVTTAGAWSVTIN